MDIKPLIDIQVPTERGHPLVACFHPYQPSLFCHTSNGIVQYDANSAFMLSRFPLGSVKCATGIAAGHDKVGNVYVSAVAQNATGDVYNCNRGYLEVQYPALIDSTKDEDVGLVAFCTGEKAYCGISSTATYTGRMHELNGNKHNDDCIECDHYSIRRKIAITTMAGSPCACNIACGTKEGLIHIYGVGCADDDRAFTGRVDLQFSIDGYMCQRAQDARLTNKPNQTNLSITAICWHPHLDGIISFAVEDGRVILFSIPRTFFIASANVGEGASVIDIIMHPTEPIMIILVLREGKYYMDVLMRIETVNQQKDVELTFLPINSIEVGTLVPNMPNEQPRLLCHSSQNRIALYFPSGRLMTFQILDFRIGRPIDGLHASQVSCPPQAFIKGVTKELIEPTIHPTIVYYLENSEQMRNRSANFMCYLKAKPITAPFSHILCPIPAIPNIQDKKTAKKFSQLRVCKIISSVDGKSVMVCFHCQLGTGSNSTQMLVSLIDLSKDNAYAAIYKEPEGSLKKRKKDADEDYLIQTFPPVTPCRDAFPIGGKKYMVLTSNKEKVHIVESAEVELEGLLTSKKKKKDKKEKKKKGKKEKKGKKGKKGAAANNDDDDSSDEEAEKKEKEKKEKEAQDDVDILGGLDFGNPTNDILSGKLDDDDNDPSNFNSSTGLSSFGGGASSTFASTTGSTFNSTVGGGMLGLGTNPEEGEEDVGGQNVKLLYKAENIFPTPFISRSGTVMMYAVYDEGNDKDNGLMWLVYSKNKSFRDIGLPEGYQMMDFKSDPNGGICLGKFKFVHQVVWQKVTEPTEIPLIAVVTESKLLIIRSDNNSIILQHSISHTFVPVWYGYTVLIPTDTGQIDYVTCKGNVHYLCTLDYYTSGYSIVGVFPDRIIYGCRSNNLSIPRIVQRGLVPTEALILGILDAPPELIPPNMLYDVIQRYYPHSSEGSEGPGPNMGISPDLLYGLLKYGYPEYAHFIAKSGENVSIFRHLPQIPPVVKSILCTYLHEWKEGFYELLADYPTIQEGVKGMENGQIFTSTLPHPQSEISRKLRCLASTCIAAGEFELARWCYDLVGDEWELLLLIMSQTKISKPLLEQIMRRSHNKLGDVYMTACALLEKKKDLKSKKQESPLDLPIRNQQLITIEKTTRFPPFPTNNTAHKMIKPEPPTEPLKTVGPELILDTISSWVGALKPLEKEIDEDEEGGEGGLDLGPSIGVEGEDTIVGYWRCDEDDTEKPNRMLIDTSKHTNNGIITGVYSYIECDAPVDPGEAGKVKKQSTLCVGINGEERGEGFVTFAFKEKSTLALGFGEKSTKRQAFTYEMWIKKELDTEQTILLRGKKDKPIWTLTTVGTEFTFATSKQSISTKPREKEAGQEQDPPANFPVNQWVHIAVTLDTTGEIPHCRLLSNGTVVGEGDIEDPGESGIAEGEDGLYFGLKFTGYVTEMRYWANNRSPEDIQDFKDTHLDMAEAKKKIQVAIHPRNCQCEKCVKRREALKKTNIRLNMDGGAPGAGSEEKKVHKTKRGHKKDENKEGETKTEGGDAKPADDTAAAAAPPPPPPPPAPAAEAASDSAPA